MSLKTEKMAQAFYPTNDGHVGNLEKKSTRELRDLLARQERVIHNRRLLKILPDKGAKVLGFASQLRECIKQRDSQSNIPKAEVRVLTKPTPGKFEGVSKFKQEKVGKQKNETIVEREEPASIGKTDIAQGTAPHAKDVVSLDQGDSTDVVNLTGRSTDKIKLRDNHECLQDSHVADTCDEASDSGSVNATSFDNHIMEIESFQGLSLGDDDSRVYGDGPPKHYYEIAEQRARENRPVLKDHLKMNRDLKVSSVQDLPPEFTQPGRGATSVASNDKMDLSKSPSQIVESAACPPVYKYKAKVISLDESLTLQQQQKSRQEELQAEMAAERLAQRLNIRMEPYNPEGVDMSYRVEKRDDRLHAVDSDDDSGDDLNPLADMLSDSED